MRAFWESLLEKFKPAVAEYFAAVDHLQEDESLPAAERAAFREHWQTLRPHAEEASRQMMSSLQAMADASLALVDYLQDTGPPEQRTAQQQQHIEALQQSLAQAQTALQAALQEMDKTSIE